MEAKNRRLNSHGFKAFMNRPVFHGLIHERFEFLGFNKFCGKHRIPTRHNSSVSGFVVPNPC